MLARYGSKAALYLQTQPETTSQSRPYIEAFKRATASIGRLDARFYDLRHGYTVATLRSGDDIKTVQGNLGHATATFTQDVYGHVTMQMKEVSAAHIEKQFPWDKAKVQSRP